MNKSNKLFRLWGATARSWYNPVAVTLYLLAMALCQLTFTPVVLAACSVNQAASPHNTINSATEKVLELIKQAQTSGQGEASPQFYRQLDTIISPVFDINYFVRRVMGGRYSSKKAYAQLKNAKEKQRFNQRLERFSKKFKDGLFATYGKGLLAFGGEETELVPATAKELEAIASGGKVTVEQHILRVGQDPYVVRYRMQFNADNCRWNVINVQVQGINLGKIYRSQFVSALKRNNGDVDIVIDGWAGDNASN